MQNELLSLFNDSLLDAILTDKTLTSKSQNDKTLMSSKDNDKEMNKILMPSKNDDDDDDDETMNQNSNNIIKQWNDYLDEIIDKSKSFEDHIKSIRKVENLNEYCFINDYGNKELEFKIFKLKLAYLSKIIDKKIFKRIFGHTFKTANKLINATNKEELIVINPSNRCNNLIKAINLILDFNETIRLDLIWKYKNQKKSEWF